MSVIKFALQRISEEEISEAYEKDNTLAYWTAYLDGAEAQKREDDRNERQRILNGFREKVMGDWNGDTDCRINNRVVDGDYIPYVLLGGYVIRKGNPAELVDLSTGKIICKFWGVEDESILIMYAKETIKERECNSGH